MGVLFLIKKGELKLQNKRYRKITCTAKKNSVPLRFHFFTKIIE